LKEDRTPWARLKERTERLFSWWSVAQGIAYRGVGRIRN
jgi:hypothetical protein